MILKCYCCVRVVLVRRATRRARLRASSAGATHKTNTNKDTHTYTHTTSTMFSLKSNRLISTSKRRYDCSSPRGSSASIRRRAPSPRPAASRPCCCARSGAIFGYDVVCLLFESLICSCQIDPVRTASSGKVTLGAFRTYPANYTPPNASQSQCNVQMWVFCVFFSC